MRPDDVIQTICPVCSQFTGSHCIGRLTGNRMPVKHAGAAVRVTAGEAQRLQKELAASIKQIADAPPRRSDDTPAKIGGRGK